MTGHREALEKIELLNSHQIVVKLIISEMETFWEVTFTVTEEIPRGSRRLRAGIKKVFETDAALGDILESRGQLSYSIPKLNEKASLAYTEDYNFGPMQILRPLLMEKSFTDPLYPFQRTGVAWLLSANKRLLADDMGLGKTAQALSAARRLFRYGRIDWCLVVAPRTLVNNWIEESKFWAPELIVRQLFTGRNKSESDWSSVINRSHIVVTSYEQIRKMPKSLINNAPSLLIADEAHKLRKNKSLATASFRKLNVKKFWALTGTPLERNEEDIAVLLSLLFPSKFSYKDHKLPTSLLRSRLEEHMLRRSKKDVLSDLPPVIEKTEILPLNKAQSKSYLKAIQDHRAITGKKSFLPLFTSLRQISDLDPVSKTSSKLERIEEILSDISTSGEKAVIFSYTLDPLYSLAEKLRASDHPVGHVMLTGKMTLEERKSSIESFKKDSKVTALLATSQVGAEGLTLTEANNVLFINLWWNPSSNRQAQDRVIRIGQENVVTVRSFITEGTVETRIPEIIKEKEITFDDLISSLEDNDIQEGLI